MTIAALKSFADQYPDNRITLLSRPVAGLLMEGLPPNVGLRTVNLNEYKGLGGLRRLSRELMKEGYDVLVDWHDVLRSKVIRYFFRKAGRRVAVIDKGRKERRALTRQKDKVLTPLTPSPERYAMALKDAGFPIVLKPYRMFGDVKADITDLTDITGPKGTDRWVGIAPFAAHVGKIYPLGLMEQVIAGLQGVRIFLFGSGSTERAWCEQMEASHGNVTSLIGKSNLAKELRLMNNMDPMITMDSANMHLSALAGTKTLSIWGATHPLAGFGGMQMEGSVQVQQQMDCRPCSIFGNKRCQYDDYRCLNGITPHCVVQAAMECLDLNRR